MVRLARCTAAGTGAQHAALARASLARFADTPIPANLRLLFRQSYTVAPAYLRKSILTLAVQGKIVKQNPTDESIDRLLKKFAKREPPLRQRACSRENNWGLSA